ncbi:CK1 family protein kinase [Histomonas meleagridis]|uniref:CK1 family protein kinase n=1 Tax=Histomonas meleagridis TaxID=135588 RepID=UPI003559449F|nr:CK1 family protein kinase [Histomonas meleagridis]KAH0803276.1 CK1 family protein kinase [Histomonas meleagridis]
MELLGPSLSNTRRQNKTHKISLHTTIRLGIFMIQCIEEFHKHGFVHRDIKSGNFLLRPGHPNPLVLIDFGLSKPYIDPKTNKPYPELNKCDYHGTYKYSSYQSMEYHDQCPRDDLVAWIYSLVELVEGKLPWTNYGHGFKMRRAKKTIPPAKLFRSFPPEFIQIYEYIIQMNYNTVPHYNYIIQLLLRSIETVGFDPKTTKYDWEKFSKDKVMAYSPIPKLPSVEETKLPKKEDQIPEVQFEPKQKTSCIIS